MKYLRHLSRKWNANTLPALPFCCVRLSPAFTSPACYHKAAVTMITKTCDYNIGPRAAQSHPPSTAAFFFRLLRFSTVTARNLRLRARIHVVLRYIFRQASEYITTPDLALVAPSGFRNPWPCCARPQRALLRLPGLLPPAPRPPPLLLCQHCRLQYGSGALPASSHVFPRLAPLAGRRLALLPFLKSRAALTLSRPVCRRPLLLAAELSLRRGR